MVPGRQDRRIRGASLAKLEAHTHLLPAKLHEISGQRRSKYLFPALPRKRDLRGVQRMTRQREHGRQVRGESVPREFEHQTRIRPVQLVSRDRVSEPRGMYADLVQAAGPRMY